MFRGIFRRILRPVVACPVMTSVTPVLTRSRTQSFETAYVIASPAIYKPNSVQNRNRSISAQDWDAETQIYHDTQSELHAQRSG